jgi:hypothetical protein
MLSVKGKNRGYVWKKSPFCNRKPEKKDVDAWSRRQDIALHFHASPIILLVGDCNNILSNI